MFPVNVSMCSMYTILGYAFNIMLWILVIVYEEHTRCREESHGLDACEPGCVLLYQSFHPPTDKKEHCIVPVRTAHVEYSNYGYKHGGWNYTGGYDIQEPI